MSSHLARGANCARLELLLKLFGISAYITTDGGDIEQGGRTWREIGRSEPNHCDERAYWGFGLYALAGNTKLMNRMLSCPVRQAARVAQREADHEAAMASYAN